MVVPAWKLLLFFCFFFSGATSLVLQIVWTKELGYILGNTLYAMATVVAAFMAGLGLGSWISSIVTPRLARPIHAYALVQVVIAILGAISVFAFRSTTPLFSTLYASVGEGGGFLLVRFLVVFALLLVPVTLMGVTLPLIIGALARAKESYALEAGLAYGVNTLGAVAGTWAAGFLLVPVLGLANAALTAAVVDALVAVAAFMIARRVAASDPVPPPASEGGPWRVGQWGVGAAFLVSGAVAMVLEVAWFRLLGLTMGPTVYVFAAMLGTYLLGVGVGSAAFARWARSTRLGGIGGLALLEVLLGLVVLLSMQFVNDLPRWNSQVYVGLREALGARAFAVAHVVVAASVVLLPCLVLGACFPMAVRAVREQGDAAVPEANVGRLYVLNTIGGIAGSLAAGFWILPTIGLTKTLIGAGLVSCAIGVVLVLAAPGVAGSRRFVAAAVSGGLAIVATFVAPKLDLSLLNLGFYREVYVVSRFDDRRLEQTMLFYREGINAPVSVFNTGDGNASLRVSGKTDASTVPDDVRTQLLLGHLTTLFAKSPRQAAVIGYGCGATTGAVLAHPSIEAVDVIEIEQGVIDASPYFTCINGDPLADPRSRLLLEDGRTHLTYTSRQYDVIVSEPSNPWMAGVANLFTTEFYERVRERLAPGGVFGQWIQTYEVSRETFRTMVATVTDAFPHWLVFSTGPGDMLVVASQDPIEQPWEELRARFDAPSVRASLEPVELRDARQLAYYAFGSRDAVEAFAAGAPHRNTDDNVWLEYRMPLDLMGVGREGERGGEGSPVPQRLADDRYLRAFADVVPGLPLVDAAHGVIDLLYAPEPVFGYGNDLEHPLWTQLERELTAILRREAAMLEDRPARNAIERALAEGRSRFDARVRTAQALARGTGIDRAGLGSLARTTPDLPWVHVLLGAALLEEGRPTEALASFETGMERPMSVYYVEAIRGAAAAAERRDDVAKARALLSAAAKSKPYEVQVQLDYAALLARSGEADRAREVLADAVRLHPGHSLVERAAIEAGVPLD